MAMYCHQIPCHNLNTSTLDDCMPYSNCIKLELADFLYWCNPMPTPEIDNLLDIWAAQAFKHGNHPPGMDYQDLYRTVDATPLADILWQGFTTNFQGERLDGAV